MCNVSSPLTCLKLCAPAHPSRVMATLYDDVPVTLESEAITEITRTAVKQMRMITVGVTGWRSDPS